mmetsp:Transcript_46/g.89  ORF Transcript_46/g.89 Transcript_46/m.89 type:complete len:372 (+) Transcript_46:132-1247(+)
MDGISGGADVNFNDMLIFSARVWKVHAEELSMHLLDSTNVDEKAFLKMHKLEIRGVGTEKETLDLESNESRVAWVQDPATDQRSSQIRFVHDTALAHVVFRWVAASQGVVNAILSVTPHESFPLTLVTLRASFLTELCEIGCDICPRPYEARCVAQPTKLQHLGTFFEWNGAAEINGGFCGVSAVQDLGCGSDTLLTSSDSKVDFVFGCGAHDHIRSLVWNFSIGIKGASFGKVLDTMQGKEQCGAGAFAKMSASDVPLPPPGPAPQPAPVESSSESGGVVAGSVGVVAVVLFLVFAALGVWLFRRRVAARKRSHGSMIEDNLSQADQGKESEADQVFGRRMHPLQDNTTSRRRDGSDDEASVDDETSVRL